MKHLVTLSTLLLFGILSTNCIFPDAECHNHSIGSYMEWGYTDTSSIAASKTTRMCKFD